MSPQSKTLLENLPQVLKQAWTAALFGHAIANCFVTLDLTDAQEVESYEELQTAAERVCMTPFSLAGAACFASSLFRSFRCGEQSRTMRSARHQSLTRTPKSKREPDQQQKHEEEAAVAVDATDTGKASEDSEAVMDKKVENGGTAEAGDVSIVGNAVKVENVADENGATGGIDAENAMHSGSSDDPAEQVGTARVDIVCAGKQSALPAAKDTEKKGKTSTRVIALHKLLLCLDIRAKIICCCHDCLPMQVPAMVATTVLLPVRRTFTKTLRSL